ncbi:MAG: HAMP domain-containing histidine kinase [Promethearchaeota archaeon]|nr:MAG: HAMP domain-containing histidine kinase [Candidatus Lokiarchaeota archaeon]
MKKFSRREILLFSLIIAGIILAIIIFILIYSTGFPKDLEWLILTIIITIYVIISITAFLSIWVFLKRIRLMKKFNRLRNIFFASISHELKTPLTSIIGFTRTILKGRIGEINEEQERQLKIILNSANQLHELIKDIIDISRLEAEKLDIRKGKYNVGEELLKLKEAFIITAGKKGLEFLMDAPENLMIFNDKKRVNQILVNLIGNAIKFTDQGKVSVSVQTSNKKLKIIVEDTGIGIKEENLKKIFKPFRRVVEPGNFKEGTGLGLYLSKKLANLLGGNIFVESEFGKGSTFILSLNLEED